MEIIPLKRKITLLKGDSKKFLNSLKKEFSEIDWLASSVDWNIRYALFKPSRPSEKEFEWLKREVNKLKKLVKKVKSLPLTNEGTIKIIEERLKYMEEEFENYPFSDRKKFFLHRIKFLNFLLQKELKIG